LRLSLRVLLGFFLIVGLVAFAVLHTFLQEVKPGVRQGMEVALVDTAHLLAELAADDFRAGTLDHGRFQAAVQRYLARSPQATIWGVAKRGADFRVYCTDARGMLLFDSGGAAAGTDYSGWNDVRRTLQGHYGARSTRVDPQDPNSSRMHVAAPILVDGVLRGVLTVSTATSSVVPYAQRSERRVFRAGLALMGTALLVGLGLSFWLTRDINRLRAYAREVAEGRKAEVPRLAGVELAELGRALGAMREKLEGRQYLERYIHALTHELKSPLTAIHGALELLDEGMPEAERKLFLGNILDQELRMQRLIERLLGLATIQHRQALKEPSRVDLAALVAKVLTSLVPTFKARNLRVDRSGPGEAWVLGEAFLLEQAVTNLLDNAAGFSPRGGVIEVVLESRPGVHGIRVRDAGPGVPEYTIAQVFEPFYSLPRPGQGGKSTGLGLSFVKEVAQLHGGSARLANLPGGGAEGSLFLPGA
jgi:two-component system sensor histidine kinase CreC